MGALSATGIKISCDIKHKALALELRSKVVAQTTGSVVANFGTLQLFFPTFSSDFCAEYLEGVTAWQILSLTIDYMKKCKLLKQDFKKIIQYIFQIPS